MRYVVRSVKYFLRLLVILALLIAILMVAGLVEKDLSQVFIHGYDSLWQIALLIAVFAAIYPKFGYPTRRVIVPGPDEEVFPLIERVMTAHRYQLEKRDDKVSTWRKTSVGDRATRLWEDRITVERIISGVELEGPGKDVARLASSITDAQN